jgi:acylphosphatase
MCKHYWVSGRVQGVFFRASTHQKAQQLGVTGWVRNLRDGRVEVFACGGDEALARFEAWLQHGPRGAVVTDVEATTEPAERLDSFEIR